MADETKPVEVPKEVPATETAPAEVKTTEEAKTEDKPTEEAPAAAEASTEAAPAEDKKEEEVKPVEEGTLGHKSADAKLPGNFLHSKQSFWFGSEAVETDKLSAYLKAAKNITVARENVAWAASTGKGLLFIGSKDAPSGIINLAEAGDILTDGPTKFHFTTGGVKHSFKASSKAEAENWVSQLKLKSEEGKAAKEGIVASEAYTQTLEGFTPKKEEKKEETPAEPATEEAKTEEAAPATEEAKEETKVEEPAKEETKTEEEAAKETKEEPKRRSASRKRDSVLLNFFKKDKKETKTEEKPDEAAPATETAAEASTEAPAAPEEPAAESAVVTEEAKTEEAPKEKPTVQKRGSIFSSLLSKKEKKVEEPAKEETTEAEVAATSETAPVIPPVEATTPLDAAVSSPATVPTETSEVAPATNGDSKKEVKSEKRKSSIPFFGHKEKAEKSDGEEKAEKMSPFSKIRATIRGRAKGAEKSEEKAAEKTEDKPAEAPKEEEAPKPAVEEPAIKAEPTATTAPVVTAAA